MAGPLTAAYSIVVMLAAAVGVAALVYVTRETGDGGTLRIGLTGGAVLLFVAALVATLVLSGA